jgi:protein TonB
MESQDVQILPTAPALPSWSSADSFDSDPPEADESDDSVIAAVEPDEVPPDPDDDDSIADEALTDAVIQRDSIARFARGDNRQRILALAVVVSLIIHGIGVAAAVFAMAWALRHAGLRDRDLERQNRPVWTALVAGVAEDADPTVAPEPRMTLPDAPPPAAALPNDAPVTDEPPPAILPLPTVAQDTPEDELPDPATPFAAPVQTLPKFPQRTPPIAPADPNEAQTVVTPDAEPTPVPPRDAEPAQPAEPAAIKTFNPPAPLPVAPVVHSATAPKPARRPAGSAAGATADELDDRDLPIPEYPPEAKRRHEEGLVELEVEVLPDGSVGTVKVVKDPNSPRLCQAAVTAVRKATFQPATRDGQPVAGRLIVPFRFVLH